MNSKQLYVIITNRNNNKSNFFRPVSKDVSQCTLADAGDTQGTPTVSKDVSQCTLADAGDTQGTPTVTKDVSQCTLANV